METQLSSETPLIVGSAIEALDDIVVGRVEAPHLTARGCGQPGTP